MEHYNRIRTRILKSRLPVAKPQGAISTFFQISIYILSLYSVLRFPFPFTLAQQQKLSSSLVKHTPVMTFLGAEYRHMCFLSNYCQAACTPSISFQLFYLTPTKIQVMRFLTSPIIIVQAQLPLHPGESP